MVTNSTPVAYLEVKAPEALAPGVYDAELKSIELVQGQFGPRMRWLFDIDGFTVSAWTTTNTSAKSRAIEYGEAILGRKLGPKERIPVDELTGAGCRLTLSIGENAYNRVDEITTSPQRVVPSSTTDQLPF